MKCQITPSDNLIVSNVSNPSQVLRLDISPFYCRLFESAREQSRDYLEEIMRWADDEIENYEYVSANLMHFTAARRRSFGLKK